MIASVQFLRAEVGGIGLNTLKALTHQRRIVPGMQQRLVQHIGMYAVGHIAQWAGGSFLFDGIDGVQHLLVQAGQGARRDHLAVDLEPLTEVHHIGADGQAGLIACRRQDRRGHRRKAALAVCARDVDEFELLLGIAEQTQKLARARKARRALLPVVELQIFEGLLNGLQVFHIVHLYFL